MWNLFANCEVCYSRREQLCSLLLAWLFACSMFALSFLCTHPSTLTESSKKSKVLCDSILACETNNSNTTQSRAAGSCNEWASDLKAALPGVGSTGVGWHGPHSLWLCRQGGLPCRSGLDIGHLSEPLWPSTLSCEKRGRRYTRVVYGWCFWGQMKRCLWRTHHGSLRYLLAGVSHKNKRQGELWTTYWIRSCVTPSRGQEVDAVGR